MAEEHFGKKWIINGITVIARSNLSTQCGDDLVFYVNQNKGTKYAISSGLLECLILSCLILRPVFRRIVDILQGEIQIISFVKRNPSIR